MAVLQDTGKLIVRLAPGPVCDEGIDRTLQLAREDHAEQRARELAKSDGFKRGKEIRSPCGEFGAAIWRA